MRTAWLGSPRLKFSSPFDETFYFPIGVPRSCESVTFTKSSLNYSINITAVISLLI